MLETTILANLEKLPEALKQEVLHYTEFLVDRYTQTHAEEVRDKKRQAGTLKGTFVLPLADDFDEPLDDFKDYME
jgi:hypothetical protein